MERFQRGGGQGRSGQCPWDCPAAVNGRAFAAGPRGHWQAVRLLTGEIKLGEKKVCERNEDVGAAFEELRFSCLMREGVEMDTSLKRAARLCVPSGGCQWREEGWLVPAVARR